MKRNRRNRLLSFTAVVLFVSFLFSSDKFVFTQLKYNGNWDPYPQIYSDILEILTLTTSVQVSPNRRIIDLDLSPYNLRKELSSAPFVILLGNDEIKLSNEVILILRDYIINGGTMFIEDISELRYSKFDSSIRKILRLMFPEYKLKKSTQETVIMKSFYLIRKVTGRVILNDYIEYIEYENRPAIIYSRNNIISCWARDRFGKFIYSCIPDGEPQRFNSQKLFLNIIMYSLCGTYKMDKVHQPFIEEKLKRGR